MDKRKNKTDSNKENEMKKLLTIIAMLFVAGSLAACGTYTISDGNGTTVEIDTNVLAEGIPGITILETPVVTETVETEGAILETPVVTETVEVEGAILETPVVTETVETEAMVDETYFPEYSCSTLASCPINVVPETVFIVGYPRGCATEDVKVFMPGEVINFAGLAEIHAYNIALTTEMPRFNMTAFIESQYQDIFACRPLPTSTPTP